MMNDSSCIYHITETLSETWEQNGKQENITLKHSHSADVPNFNSELPESESKFISFEGVFFHHSSLLLRVDHRVIPQPK